MSTFGYQYLISLGQKAIDLIRSEKHHQTWRSMTEVEKAVYEERVPEGSKSCGIIQFSCEVQKREKDSDEKQKNELKEQCSLLWSAMSADQKKVYEAKLASRSKRSGFSVFFHEKYDIEVRRQLDTYWSEMTEEQKAIWQKNAIKKGWSECAIPTQ
jgi:hypothetical protein